MTTSDHSSSQSVTPSSKAKPTRILAAHRAIHEAEGMLSAGSNTKNGEESRDCGESDTAWFAVWTRSRHEQKVCRELAAKQIEVFLPTIVEVSRWKDRTKQIAWPLFPGYCFARFSASRILRVLNCTGVVAVLCNRSKPIAVPGCEIEALQRLVQSGLTYHPSPLIAEGIMVRVVKGALTGITGRLVRKGPQEQLVLAVDILKSGARVQVSAEDIRPL